MQADWNTLVQKNRRIILFNLNLLSTKDLFFPHVLLGQLWFSKVIYKLWFAPQKSYHPWHVKMFFCSVASHVGMSMYCIHILLLCHHPFLNVTQCYRLASLLLHSQVGISKSQCSFSSFNFFFPQTNWAGCRTLHDLLNSSIVVGNLTAAGQQLQPCSSSQYLSLQAVVWIPLYS